MGGTYRYTAWDENQDSPSLNADELINDLQDTMSNENEFVAEVRQDFMSYGDLSYVLRLMQRKGIPNSQGKRLQGIQGLLQHLEQRKQKEVAKAQPLLDELSPGEREGLNDQLSSELPGDTAQSTDTELPPDAELRATRSFSGQKSLADLLKTIRKINELEGQLKAAQNCFLPLDTIDEKLLRELLGDEAVEDLKMLREMTRVLEEAGYLNYKDGRHELTPLGLRRIGQIALEDVFAQLRKEHVGQHRADYRGVRGERIEETKKFDFSDDLHFHLQKTVMNSVYREPKAPPLKLSVDDFEVYRTETNIRSATVLMLDLSSSMSTFGNFDAAKRVALVLDNLVHSQYPRDSLYIVGFSSYARRLKKADLSRINWDKYDPYTNMQHAFNLAGSLLEKESCNNRQIILISDGEPTAHTANGNLTFQSPPTPQTIHLTMKEVKKCARMGIAINVFMFETGRLPSAFVTEVARVTHGRVFFTSADTLRQYLLVDFASKRRRLRNLGKTSGRSLASVAK